MNSDRELAIFAAERQRLFGLAYRMLGSVEDAEDIVQETFLRWHAADIASIESPGAWLTTVVTRLALKQLESARVTRETYIGPWLPEPLLTAQTSTPSTQAELSDSLSIAFLTLLERLSPPERAVFLLREVFDYDYDQIAFIVRLSESNCRQIFHRAKKRLAERKLRFPTNPDTHRALLERFTRAINDGDIDGVVELLAQDAVLWADGGGRARGAARRPIRGAEDIARFLVGVRRKMGSGDVTMRMVNGGWALVASIDGALLRVVSIDVTSGRIAGVYVVANPDKLRPLAHALKLV